MSHALLFFGSSPLSCVSLNKLIQEKLVTGVVTKPDKPSGRGQKLTPNPVKAMALAHSVPVYESLARAAQAITPDTIGLVAAYGKIIPQSLLDALKGRIYNIHPSLLPAYRGPSPLQSQILDGVHATGVTIIRLDAEMDHGPVITQSTDVIQPTDTWQSLGVRLFTTGTELFIAELKTGFTASEQEQAHEQATYTPMVNRQTGFIPWEELQPLLNSSDATLDRKVRGLWEWPGVWTLLPNTQRLKVKSIFPEVLVQVEGKTVQRWPIVI